MGDRQCSLCLSCGAPFLPGGNVPLFNSKGNLSVRHLNMEFQNHVELRRRINDPKFTNSRCEAHMIHGAHHQTALLHMSRHHTGDNNLVAPAPHAAIPDQNGAMPFYKTPSSKTGASIAFWAAPPARERIRLPSVLAEVQRIAAATRDLDDQWDERLNQTYTTCTDCNSIMTELSDMRFLVGFASGGIGNPHPIIRTSGVISVRAARAPRDCGLDRAYTRWTSTAGPTTRHPTLDQRDTVAPHIAYYLHLCLPAGGDSFSLAVYPGSFRSARGLYLQLAWLCLEIACLCTLIDSGKRYGNGRLSHGLKNHLGALELYMSYFLWRLFEYEHQDELHALRVDFVQWHQKYFWDAVNCRGLFPDSRTLLGELVCVDPDVDSGGLVMGIGARLMQLHTHELAPLRAFILGGVAGVPREVSAYFLPPALVARLGRLSARSTTVDDMDSTLEQFGVSALMFRVIQLCRDYPTGLKRQLQDFRTSWRWREIDNLRRANHGSDAQTAHILYTFTTLLDPPARMPTMKEQILASMDGPCCSPWASVLALRQLGAFTQPEEPE